MNALRTQALAAALLLMPLGALAAPGCGTEGAFGILFGSKPPAGARLVSKGKAANWYALSAPEPDARFDSYQIRVDSANGEVFDVVASKTITEAPALGKPPLDALQRQQGEARAKAFAEAYVASLPPELQSKLALEKYSSTSWTGQVAESVLLSINASFAWDVTVACKDIRREWGLARRVLPELFEGKPR